MSSSGTGEGGSDERRLRKGEHQSSVPELGGIGDENLKDIEDAIVSDIVDDIGGSVSFDVGGSRHDDETKDGTTEHNRQTFSATPDIDHLSDRQTKDTSDDKGHCGRNGGQLMGGEGAVDIWGQAEVDLGLQRENKVGEVDTDSVSHVWSMLNATDVKTYKTYAPMSDHLLHVMVTASAFLRPS